MTANQILSKQLRGVALTAEENEAIWLKDGYSSSLAVPWESIRDQVLYLGSKHIYLYMPLSEINDRTPSNNTSSSVVIEETDVKRVWSFFSKEAAKWGYDGFPSVKSPNERRLVSEKQRQSWNV